MSYKQLKWLILATPTLTIGIWEFVRHEFLLPYISMDLGNWLAPAVVFLVSVLLLTRLFRLIEQAQEELNRTRALQAVMEEREKIAQELHDGIAQSLFFLNAQVSQLERALPVDNNVFLKLKESVFRANDYVRQAIANLRESARIGTAPWLQGMVSLIDEMRRETDLQIHVDWRIPDDGLSSKGKVELLAIIREALINVHKHAEARNVKIEGRTVGEGWQCTVADDGKGFDPERSIGEAHFGIKIMKDRARSMKWHFSIDRVGEETCVIVRKEGTSDGPHSRSDRG